MIRKLEMLLALAKEQHFGRAAVSLGITQPTLSTGIQQLEDHLGVKLVHRGSRFGGLTPEGQRALIWARTILRDTRRMRDEMRASHEGLSGHLRLAVIPTALTWAAQLSAAFNRKHPNVSFSILSRSSASISDHLDNLDADAGITYLTDAPLGRVTSVPLYHEHYAVLCQTSHPLSQQPQIGWADLADARLCLLTPDMQNRRIIDGNLGLAGLTAKPLVESNSTILLVSNVLHGGFVTILPTDLAQFLAVGHDLAVVPLKDAGPTPSVGLITQHHEPHTPVLGALVKLARDLAD